MHIDKPGRNHKPTAVMLGTMIQTLQIGVTLWRSAGGQHRQYLVTPDPYIRRQRGMGGTVAYAPVLQYRYCCTH
jgi:hypothetical protein